MLFLLLACAEPDPTPDPTCVGLYGSPNENTGLELGECTPNIGEWVPREWSPGALAELRELELESPPQPLTSDPYLEPAPQTGEGVCAVQGQGGQYTLASFDSVQEAEEQGAIPTHGGACGLCSSLEDLQVYARYPDLTQPVRACGLEGFGDGVEGVQDCLLELGFTPACASIWAYNVEHTRAECQEICIELLSEPYHAGDGSLNGCLQCDEDRSGPVFKALAGRTRRNSGLASALCRPCETVWRIGHDYEKIVEQ
jgi:hypothetical protein